MSLTVCRAEPQHVALIRELYAQPHAYAATLQLPLPSLELWQQRYNAASADYTNLVALDGEKLRGQLGLMTRSQPRRKHTASLGMAVCASSLRQGVGSALLSTALDLCDNWLNIQRIELELYTDNDAALALYQKHGFVIEGEHKDYAFRNGSYVDTYSMARLRTNA